MLDEFEIPAGPSGQYHYVRTNGSSMVIPLTDSGEIIMVNQYRYLGDRESIEFPCGSVETGCDYLQTARHELQQETGYNAGQIREVGQFNPYNGVTNEICKVFLASNLQESTAKPDATEEFEVLRRTHGQIEAMIRNGEIWDGMTLAAWMLARNQINGLDAS